MKSNVVFGLKIFVVVIIFLWVGIVMVDYFKARGAKDPVFCLSEQVKIFNDDGTLQKTVSKKEFDAMSNQENLKYTYKCVGLGYKVYRYHREFNAVEFGPFFISERTGA